MFTDILFSIRPPVAISFAVRFLPTSLLNRRPPVAQSFCFTFLPAALLYSRPPGAPSFAARFYLPRCLTRDLRGPHLSLFEERSGRKTNQRAPKPPFGFWLFIRGFGGETCGPYYEFARVQLTRFRPVRGVLRTVSTDSVVLLQLRRIRWHLENNQPDL